MSTDLNQLLVTGLEWLKQAGEFTAEQAPLVVQEYLAWELTSNIYLIVFWAVMLTLSLVLANAGLRTWRAGISDQCFDKQALAVATIVLALVASLISFVGAAVSGYRAVKVSVAPRVVLIEKFSELVKGASK